MSNNIKVLIVDDEEQFRSTTKKILEKRGFEVTAAKDGKEAVKKLKERPDVVILDIKMQGMDGHATLSEIKKENKNIPVIMLTGHGASTSAKAALDEGAFDYLTKPCDIEILAGKINDAFYFKTDTKKVYEEKRVKDIMIPINEYTTVNIGDTVKDAILELRKSFLSKISASQIMETGHRSLLIFDNSKKIQGILTIVDLLKAVMPSYLSAEREFTTGSISYSAMFWTGLFTKAVKDMADQKVEDIMSPLPETIQADSNLMEASFQMLEKGKRRLLVKEDEKIIGIIREQDLFFEMEKIFI